MSMIEMPFVEPEADVTSAVLSNRETVMEYVKYMNSNPEAEGMKPVEGLAPIDAMNFAKLEFATKLMKSSVRSNAPLSPEPKSVKNLFTDVKKNDSEIIIMEGDKSVALRSPKSVPSIKQLKLEQEVASPRVSPKSYSSSSDTSPSNARLLASPSHSSIAKPYSVRTSNAVLSMTKSLLSHSRCDFIDKDIIFVVTSCTNATSAGPKSIVRQPTKNDSWVVQKVQPKQISITYRAMSQPYLSGTGDEWHIACTDCQGCPSVISVPVGHNDTEERIPFDVMKYSFLESTGKFTWVHTPSVSGKALFKMNEWKSRYLIFFNIVLNIMSAFAAGFNYTYLGTQYGSFGSTEILITLYTSGAQLLCFFIMLYFRRQYFSSREKWADSSLAEISSRHHATILMENKIREEATLLGEETYSRYMFLFGALSDLASIVCITCNIRLLAAFFNSPDTYNWNDVLKFNGNLSSFGLSISVCIFFHIIALSVSRLVRLVMRLHLVKGAKEWFSTGCLSCSSICEATGSTTKLEGYILIFSDLLAGLICFSTARLYFDSLLVNLSSPINDSMFTTYTTYLQVSLGLSFLIFNVIPNVSEQFMSIRINLWIGNPILKIVSSIIICALNVYVAAELAPIIAGATIGTMKNDILGINLKALIVLSASLVIVHTFNLFYDASRACNSKNSEETELNSSNFV